MVAQIVDYSCSWVGSFSSTESAYSHNTDMVAKEL